MVGARSAPEKIGYFAFIMRAREARPKKKKGYFAQIFFQNNKTPRDLRNRELEIIRPPRPLSSEIWDFLSLRGGGFIINSPVVRFLTWSSFWLPKRQRTLASVHKTGPDRRHLPISWHPSDGRTLRTSIFGTLYTIAPSGQLKLLLSTENEFM